MIIAVMYAKNLFKLLTKMYYIVFFDCCLLVFPS